MKKQSLYRKLITCNSFEAGGGGNAGTLNYQAPLNTHSSPDVSQNPAKFVSGDLNKYYDPYRSGQPDTETTDTDGTFDKDVEKLFQGKEKPTVDDILTALDMELSKMIHKDKNFAKRTVIDNMLKHGAKYYTKLDNLNINDKEMNMDPSIQEQEKSNLINLLDKMVEDKKARRIEPNTAIQDILKEKENNKINRLNNLVKKII